jgi:hypothetical protein
VQGIDEAPIRESIVQNVFATNATPITAAGQGSALAALQQNDRAANMALSNAELGVAAQDEQIKFDARNRVAQIMSQKNQMEATRQAKLKENRLLIEQEAQSRKMKLIGTALGFGIAAAGGAPAIGGAIGKGFGNLFGKEQEENVDVIAGDLLWGG